MTVTIANVYAACFYVPGAYMPFTFLNSLSSYDDSGK